MVAMITVEETFYCKDGTRHMFIFEDVTNDDFEFMLNSLKDSYGVKAVKMVRNVSYAVVDIRLPN